MDFQLYAPVRVLGGEHCIRNNARELAALGSRALIVTGASAAKKCGALDDVTTALDDAGIPWTHFGGVRENPLLSTCAEAAALARSRGADFLIGIGGGSVIDATRAAAALATGDYGDPAQLFARKPQRCLPFAAVGTTAGTGSEVDHISVLTDDADGKKKGLNAPCLFPALTLCDARYTVTMDLRQTVSTALDALCHCLESWLSRAATEPTACFARRGAELIYPWLRDIAEGTFDPNNLDMRRDLYHGSLWGGLAIAQSGTGFPHPAGYLFTELGGLPHGVACALFEADFLMQSLPHVDDRTLDAIFAIAESTDDLCEVLDILTENDLTVSQHFCDAVGERLAGAANTAKTLGEFSAAAGQEITEALFLESGQEEDVLGGWQFGLEE